MFVGVQQFLLQRVDIVYLVEQQSCLTESVQKVVFEEVDGCFREVTAKRLYSLFMCDKVQHKNLSFRFRVFSFGSHTCSLPRSFCVGVQQLLLQLLGCKLTLFRFELTPSA